MRAGADRVEVRANGERVALGQLGVVGIGHGGVEQFAVMPLALAQGPHELFVAPGADASFGIGRDVSSHHDSERRLDRPAASERLARAGHGMAARAVADRGEIMPPLDLVEILWVQTRPDFVLRAPRRDQTREDRRGDHGADAPPCARLTHGRAVRGFSDIAS